MIDWRDWRKCRVCLARIGEPCRSRSGRVVDGQPDQVPTVLERPHFARVARVRRLTR